MVSFLVSPGSTAIGQRLRLMNPRAQPHAAQMAFRNNKYSPLYGFFSDSGQ
jgi:hypothetical protein